MSDVLELAPEAKAEIKAQMRRRRAYEEGVYELDEDEGFRCEECGWHELFVPIDFGSGGFAVYCPECDAEVDVAGDPDEHLEQWK